MFFNVKFGKKDKEKSHEPRERPYESQKSPPPKSPVKKFKKKLDKEVIIKREESSDKLEQAESEENLVAEPVGQDTAF